MPLFKFVGQCSDGQVTDGVVEAPDIDEAVNKVRENCEAVLEIAEIHGKKFNLFAPIGKVTAKALSLMCKQFSIILRAGLPLTQAVYLASMQCQDSSLKALLKQVAEDINNGWSLSYSFDQRGSDVLPVTFLEAVKAGEESGDMAPTFERLSEYFERMNKTRDKIIGALTYPVLVIAVAVIVVGIIMVYAVPAFIGMFEGIGGELPFVTKALIAVSNFFTRWWIAVAGVVALVMFVFKMYSATEQGGLVISRMQVKIPIIGPIIQAANASQFARTMSTMLYAGTPILQAVVVSARTMSNICMATDVSNSVGGVESGLSLGDCLGVSKSLPPMLVQMVAVGESSGSLESTMRVIADYYDNETDTRTKRAISLLEPAIIIVLAVFVMFLLLAVYLPMFQLYGDMSVIG